MNITNVCLLGLRQLLLLLLLLTFFPSSGQALVNLQEIKQKKIKKMFRESSLTSAQDFLQLPTACLDENSGGYNTHVKSFMFNYSLSNVWDAYLQTPPNEAWEDNSVSYGLMFASQSQQFYYAKEQTPQVDVGQMIFINLNLLKGMIHVAVGHKIMELNKDEHLIRTCYVESGKSSGTQFIRFSENELGQTIVEHTTYFKSSSPFRDKYLYPRLHERIITEFHRNIYHHLLLNNTQKQLAKAEVHKRPKAAEAAE